jgi:hypothetical protein
MAVYTTITKIDAELPSHSPDDAVVFRPEQNDAIDRAFKYFKKKKSNQKYLWNAKMRFGKTLCALELARKMGSELVDEAQVHRTLIVTHRPVVKQSWKEDFEKIFGKDCESYHYGTKFDDDGTGDFYELEKTVTEEDKSYIFFASMQYLRRSTLVGGDNDEQLKKDILQNAWDLVVIDEAHEGTQTNLGQRVIDFLIKDKPTKALHLSGTPFNLYEDFTDEQIYTWDYIKEQTAKREWSQNNPLLPPEDNPYLELPEMEIRTFDLGKLVKADLGDDASFQFKEFFRTYQGQNVPEDKKGKFVHEDAVKEFLDRMCQEDETSHYPFSTEEYRTFFNHTLWVVPGVKEAKALEDLLNDHEIFGDFDAIINVAGKNEDDETRQDALQKVKDKIGVRPDLTYTITISCGRLTTGVTVRPWTAVFYLKGSENTSAATYMQTIFRVQSPYNFKDSNGDVQLKTKCYVFDFAPDRTLKMVAETAKFATLTQKQKKYARAATTREKDIENMENFLSFCPVIAMEGGTMVEFKADKLFEQLEHVYVDRVVRNGFNDNSVYDIRELMNLEPEEIKELDEIGVEISKTTNMEKPKRATNIEVSKNKLTPNQKAAAERAHKKEKAGKELTEEEKAALEAEKKRKEEERKERDNRITILRGIALRIPLLMYGANVTDEDEGITLQNFTRLVDDSSWAEFMPRGVDKKAFNKFKKCFNATIFVAAGKRYRQLAREADDMHINERIQRIAEIFSYFHNPDKETVLTPWRVVNMHMSDCLGGYTFFNERFDGPAEKEVIGTNGALFEWIPTTEPRYVDRGSVTREVFGDSNAKILEINSKTGLYPLYVAYSLYRQRCKDFVKAGLIEDEDNYSIEEEQVIWDDILANNVYVICNTPMAERITHRTLLGFRTLYQRNGTEQVNIKSEKLIERATTDKDGLIADINRSGYWCGTRNKEEMKFSAVVGNPPYQIVNKGNGNGADPLYHIFIDLAMELSEKGSLIHPARFLFKAGKTPKDWNEKMLNNPHFKVVDYWADSSFVFPSVDVKGGIATTYWDKKKDMGKIGFFSAYDELHAILFKVQDFNELSFSTIVGPRELYRLTDTLYSENPEMDGRQSAGHKYSLGANIFDIFPELFFDECPSDNNLYAEVYGRYNNQRGYKWLKKTYFSQNENYLETYNVFVPEANGTGAIGEVLSTPIIGTPMIGHTDTFISVGQFDTMEEATACLKYVQSKFARTMLGTLKATQHNPRDTWANVPLQDFTSNSDIDWSKSVAEIDQQLYKKYGLSQDEQDFIESMIKPME